MRGLHGPYFAEIDEWSVSRASNGHPVGRYGPFITGESVKSGMEAFITD
jgi:hypothetical protein